MAQGPDWLATVRLEAEHGKIAGAAAEIADQNGGRRGKAAYEAIAGGFRLQRGLDRGPAGGRIGAAQPLLTERVVGSVAGEADRTAGDQQVFRGVARQIPRRNSAIRASSVKPRLNTRVSVKLRCAR